MLETKGCWSEKGGEDKYYFWVSRNEGWGQDWRSWCRWFGSWHFERRGRFLGTVSWWTLQAQQLKGSGCRDKANPSPSTAAPWPSGGGGRSSWSWVVGSPSSQLTPGAYPKPTELLETCLYPCQSSSQCRIQLGLLRCSLGKKECIIEQIIHNQKGNQNNFSGMWGW